MGLRDDAEVDIGPKRDRWGRPLLVPRGSAEKVPYSRASSLSDYASGVKTGLETWKRRLAVVGVAQREDIAAMIAALPSTDTGDKKDDAVTKAQLDEYIEEALISAGASAKANWGTAVHGFTTDGVGVEHAPERMKADIEAYERELGRLGITPIADEVFVACDEVRAAGTFDHLYRLPDGRVVVGDKKTGVTSYLDAAIQMSIYAHGEPYDWSTDRRAPLSPIGFDPSVGLHVSIPRGEGRCETTMLDLDYGFELAKHAAFLRDAGYAANRDRLMATSPEGLLLEAIWACSTREALKKVMADISSDDAKEAANQRWKELA